MLKDIGLIIVGIIIGIVANEFIMPFISKQLINRDDLISIGIIPNDRVYGLDSKLAKYDLAIENKSKKNNIENIYVSLDLPLTINNVIISADQGVVGSAVSKGSTPMLYQNNQAVAIPTNHINLSAQNMNPRGLFAVSIFVDKNPSIAAAPFPGLKSAEVNGVLQYSYRFLGSVVKRTMKFTVPQLKNS